MSKTMNQIQDDIVNEFSTLDDWFAIYEYIIESGKSLERLNEEFRSEENNIGGCQSEVWIKSERKKDKIHFSADSDSLIVKGMISLLFEVINNQNPKDILDVDFYFIDQIGLNNHLSPTRLNGLNSIIKKIKTDARNYAINPPQSHNR
jgi:cysteine desulfuration protein SufE